MLRARSLLLLIAFGLTSADSFATPGRDDRAPITVFQMPLPGGLPAALAVLQDRVTPDRGQFLLEVIRRVHHAPEGLHRTDADRLRDALLAHLGTASLSLHDGDTVPLPLPPSVWTDVVFPGRNPASALSVEILRARGPALLYYGLFSLDDQTRLWLAGRSALMADLAWTHAARFVMAAPGLRVAGGSVRVPGGEAAEPVWQSLVGRPVDAPEEFIRALIGSPDGRLAYFFSAMAALSVPQVTRALHLDGTSVAERVAAGHRLLRVFERIEPQWTVEARTFWRPPRDPAVLLADVPLASDGSPALPGTRAFWTAVLAAASGHRKAPAAVAPALLPPGPTLDFSWLADQVFSGGPIEQEKRYRLVLFASRMLRRLPPESTGDVIEAVRAAATFPALAVTLERAGVLDPLVHARAARRAAALAAIRNTARATRAVAQFQGALAIVVRAAARGSLPRDALPAYITSLAAVEVSARGEYEGGIVRWLWEHLPRPEGAGTSAEGSLLRALAGGPSGTRYVDWEGMRYRLDVAGAESIRLSRRLGEARRPHVQAASDLVAIADDISGTRNLGGNSRAAAESLRQVARRLGWNVAPPPEYRQALGRLERFHRTRDARDLARVVPALLTMADGLLARGLTELVYAAALGHAEVTSASAGDVAARHDFGFSAGRERRIAWQLPVQGADVSGWRVEGALLGLDVTLAEFSLLRVSRKPLASRPTLPHLDRRAMIEAVALLESSSLADADRDSIAGAIRRGRARLEAVTAPLGAAALADAIGLSSARRALLQWTATHDPSRLPAFLSPSELLWLGLEGRPVGPALQAWGAHAGPRLGCHCLQLSERPSWEVLAGRWHTGILASGFPDLNLRLTELLEELNMPAALLQPVLASATREFVDAVVVRDQDDRRGLIDFVQALHADRLEQYLALLTTDGPLVFSEGGEDGRDVEAGTTAEVSSRRTDAEVTR